MLFSLDEVYCRWPVDADGSDRDELTPVFEFEIIEDTPVAVDISLVGNADSEIAAIVVQLHGVLISSFLKCFVSALHAVGVELLPVGSP